MSYHQGSTPSPAGSLPAALSRSVFRWPDAPALQSRDGRSVCYAALWRRVTEMCGRLRSLGVGQQDRVALVLPHGPELAATLVSVECSAIALPLSTAMQVPELERRVRAGRSRLILGATSQADVVQRVGELTGAAVLIGEFAHEGAPAVLWDAGSLGSPIVPEPSSDDTCVLLPTSGTTGRPRLVRVSHGQRLGAAAVGAEVLRQTPEDLVLISAGLGHVSASTRSLWGTLLTGGCAMVLSRPDPEAMLDAMATKGITWYWAVPMVHAALLRASQARSGLSLSSLRMIVSSAAALPPEIMRGLERRFCVPVIEAYGMTEVLGMLTANQLPPGERKAGSVGWPVAGCQIAIASQSGAFGATEKSGEVLARSERLAGRDNDQPNISLLSSDGWYHTGDLGFLDADGALHISGRIREMINVAGAKVAPVEVEEALCAHPKVREAIAFSVPHRILGEVVGAAFVPEDGCTPTEDELIAYLAGRLSDIRLPIGVLGVDAIPRGPAGKPLRLEASRLYADRVGADGQWPSPAATRVSSEADAHQPSARDEIIEPLLSIWRTVLSREDIRDDQSFFDLGGTSLLAARVVAAIERRFGVALEPTAIYDRMTIGELVKSIARAKDEHPASNALSPAKSGVVFLVAPGSAYVYRSLRAHLSSNVALNIIEGDWTSEATPLVRRIEELAGHCVRQVRDIQASGPYFLGGYSLGGTVALEMARQLRAQGSEIAMLVMFDSHKDPGDMDIRVVATRHADTLRRLPLRLWGPYLAQRQLALAWVMGALSFELFDFFGKPVPASVRAHFPEIYNLCLLGRYDPEPYDGSMIYFDGDGDGTSAPYNGWEGVVTGGIEVHRVSGGHSLLTEPHIRHVCQQLEECLRSNGFPFDGGNTGEDRPAA